MINLSLKKFKSAKIYHIVFVTSQMMKELINFIKLHTDRETLQCREFYISNSYESNFISN